MNRTTTLLLRRKLTGLLFVFAACMCSNMSFSNNLTVGNTLLTGSNSTLDYTLVQFDLSWDNSWRTSTFESNWDAAWVFVKYRVNGTGAWNHATLNAGGHTAPSGSVITPSTDGKGAFIYRSAVGSGTNSWTSVQLRWDYGVNGVLDSDVIEVCVFAIEMVNIPQGAFYLGDGGGSGGQGGFETGTTNVPYQVLSEAAITLGGGGATSLGNHNSSGMYMSDDFSSTVSQTLPAAFPKGYNAFYIMKYELTQVQYVDFLNKLTYTQQVGRTAVSPSSSAGTGALANSYRNGIDIMTPGVSSTTPAVYACNLNGNGTYNEAADGHNIACNQIGWNDLAAYLDWSGLRPITELEYEKACRGTQAAVADEYAWGDATLTCASAVSNSGQANEVATAAGAKCNCDNSLGAIRVGAFAKAGTTTRTASGGSYYGVMDLSGSLWEALVAVGQASGRSFTGNHGDGTLTAAGNANVTAWPGITGAGVGYRGGAWTVPDVYLRVSARVYENYVSDARDYDFMARGARTQ